MRSISDSKKSRGRPKTGIGKAIGLRLYPDLEKRLDEWIARQRDKPSRPEAIRCLLGQALSATPIPRVKFRKGKHDPCDVERELDEALAATFPASDQVEMEEPAPRKRPVRKRSGR